MRTTLLKSAFGHDAFHPGQEELIDALQSGRDLLGVMATGQREIALLPIPGGASARSAAWWCLRSSA